MCFRPAFQMKTELVTIETCRQWHSLSQQDYSELKWLCVSVFVSVASIAHI